ncbi:MAG TPA: ABC transporter permease [Acidimicrobiia bacterium]|nr:ABC transporter permease [Acidimicrobiia bacterium]
MRSLITILAFAGKEIRQVLRQPRLMTALVVGPFLILGLFAAGFEPDPPPPQALLVVPEGSEIQARAGEIQEALSDEIEIAGTTADEDEARRRLLDGDVDLVVVAPREAAETIRASEQATVMVLHNRLDPFDRAFITVSAGSAVDELNRVVLSEVAETAQAEAGDYGEALPSARRSVGLMADALRRGDETEARQAQSEAADSLATVEDQLGLSSDFLQGVDRALGAESDSLGGEVSTRRSEVEAIDAADPAAAEQAEALEQDLAELENGLAEFRSISPDVLVQPFIADTELVQGTDIPLTTYYSPAVVVVLLQHVVLTFAALSVVSERSTGSTELFRVGPVRVGEFLAGKFLGYALLGIIVAGLLMALVVFVFGTPMFGSWVWASVILGLTMAASLGLGFIIAAAANTDAQAVQFSMLALLFTIFFSGLVVSLSRLVDGVRQVAYLAPATAGTEGLQDVMFRGAAPSGVDLAILLIYSIVSLVLAYVWLQRRQVA